MCADPDVELAKTLEPQALTRRDFEERLLPEMAWLNDNIIIGSLLHIADHINTKAGATGQTDDPKCVAFTSYFWPRLEKNGPKSVSRLMRRACVGKNNLLDIETILIPICSGSHWTLVVVRPGKRTVAHMDSIRGGAGDRRVAEIAMDWVKATLEENFSEDKWGIIDYEAPRQTNGWDCGVFTITNALCMALGLDPKSSYTAKQLTIQRHRLAAILLNEGFKGDFDLEGL
jgi:Ulp1 family protease